MRATSRLSTKNLVPGNPSAMAIVERTDDLNRRLLAGGYREKPRVVWGESARRRGRPIFIRSHRVPAELTYARLAKVSPKATGWVTYMLIYPGEPLIEPPRSGEHP